MAKFNHLNVPNSWQQYWTKYPEGYSIIEALINWVGQVDDMVDNINDLNDRMDEFIESFEADLQDTVADMLNEWKDDGTLADIINNEVFGEKQNISDLPYIDVVQHMNRLEVDFTTAFKYALTLSSLVDAMRIIVPYGQYTLTEELVIGSNTIIQLGQGVVLSRGHTGYLFVNGERTDTTTAYNGNSNIRIEGGTLDGMGTIITDKASVLHFSHAQNIELKDVTIKDPANSHHVEFNSTRNIVVEDCRFLGWAGTVDTYNEAIQLDIAKLANTIIGAGDGTPCRNVTISNCYFGDSGTAGSNHIARAVGGHNATIGSRIENVSIVNCVMENTLSIGVRCYNWSDVTISGNHFINCGAGINVRAAITGVDTQDAGGINVGAEQNDNFTIANNTFYGTTSAGRMIEIFGESGTNGLIHNVSITGNTLNMTGATDSYDALIFSDCRVVSATGNTILNCTGNGIVLRSTQLATLSGNTLDNIGEDGVNIQNSTFYTTLTGNTLRKVGINGVYVSAAVGFDIVGNTFAGVNGIADAGDPRNHIRVVSSSTLGTIVGNTCRNFSTTHTTPTALFISNTTTNTITTSNNTAGFTNSIASTGGTLDPNGNLV